MTSEVDTSHPGGDPAAIPHSPRPEDLDDTVAETPRAVGEPSDRTACANGPARAKVSETEIAPEARQYWDDRVRGFADSIDVRLDILEEELGGLHDEVNRLHQAVQEGIKGAQRRLVRLFVAGHLLLGLLIFVLFLMVWPTGGLTLHPGQPPRDVSARPAPTPKTGTATRPGATPRDARANEGAAGAEAETAPSSPPKPKPEKPAADSPERPSPPEAQDIADPAGEAQPAEKDRGEPAGETGQRVEPAPTVAAAAPAATAHLPAPPAPQAESVRGGDAQSRPTSEGPESAGSDQTAPSLPADKDGDGAAVEPPGTADPPSNTTMSPDPGPIVLEGERYAIQLISFHSESRVEQFVERFGIADEALYTYSQTQDKDWYAVFLGVFGTREEGAAAVSALPQPLRELGPWLRSLPPGTELARIGTASDVEAHE